MVVASCPLATEPVLVTRKEVMLFIPMTTLPKSWLVLSRARIAPGRASVTTMLTVLLLSTMTLPMPSASGAPAPSRAVTTADSGPVPMSISKPASVGGVMSWPPLLVSMWVRMRAPIVSAKSRRLIPLGASPASTFTRTKVPLGPLSLQLESAAASPSTRANLSFDVAITLSSSRRSSGPGRLAKKESGFRRRGGYRARRLVRPSSSRPRGRPLPPWRRRRRPRLRPRTTTSCRSGVSGRSGSARWRAAGSH